MSVDPSLEGKADAEPECCDGPHRLRERGLTSELEEVIGNGDRVVVVVRTPRRRRTQGAKG